MAIFGIKRERVKTIRAKRAKETLKRRKGEQSLEQKTAKAKAQSSYFQAKADIEEAKARRRKAQKAHRPSFGRLLPKKKQGKTSIERKRVQMF